MPFSRKSEVPSYVIGLVMRRAQEQRQKKQDRTNAMYAFALQALAPLLNLSLFSGLRNRLQKRIVKPKKTV